MNKYQRKLYMLFYQQKIKTFKHPGIDAKGITRAVFKNIENIISGSRLEGASTITQQVAKNFY